MSCKFPTKLKIKGNKKNFVICITAFNPNKILTCWVHQNDSQNLSFVKAIDEVGKKRPEMLEKWPTPSFVLFVSKQSLFYETISFFFFRNFFVSLLKLS